MNLVGIGTGGMGAATLRRTRVTAPTSSRYCDVGDRTARGSGEAFPQAPRYKDFRQLIDKEAKNIDAVTVGTPDHIHAVGLDGGFPVGKHVYCRSRLRTPCTNAAN